LKVTSVNSASNVSSWERSRQLWMSFSGTPAPARRGVRARAPATPGTHPQKGRRQRTAALQGTAAADANEPELKHVLALLLQRVALQARAAVGANWVRARGSPPAARSFRLSCAIGSCPPPSSWVGGRGGGGGGIPMRVRRDPQRGRDGSQPAVRPAGRTFFRRRKKWPASFSACESLCGHQAKIQNPVKTACGAPSSGCGDQARPGRDR